MAKPRGGDETRDVFSVGPEHWGSGPLYSSVLYRRPFHTPGRFQFYCSFHPEMRGTVILDPL